MEMYEVIRHSAGQYRHRYIARIPLAGGLYRYFYDREELNAYMAAKNKAKGDAPQAIAKPISKSAPSAASTKDKASKGKGSGGGKGRGSGGGKGKGKGGKGKGSKASKGSAGVSSSAHLPTASTGKIVSGYTGKGKPEGMSDERWAQLQKIWSTTYSAAKKKRRMARPIYAGPVNIAEHRVIRRR